MQVRSLLLLSLGCCSLLLGVARAQTITRPPVSTTAALGTNATFSCRGTGGVLWQINGTQVRAASQVPNFENAQVFVPLPRPDSSELIVTATEVTNATLVIICVVDPGIGMGELVMSDAVKLLVYAEPNPPTDLMLNMDGLALVATWMEPFSLEGEELSYVITIMNRGNVVEDGVTVNTTRYVLSEPIGERDCSEYVFTVFSENNFSKSRNAITGRANIPTEPLQMRSSDVDIQVSLSSGVSATIEFRPRDPCPAYPVDRYNFTITERETDQLVDSVIHTGNISLVVGSSNGLVADQIYMLTIEAVNSVGSSISEDEILLYTTGLQSSTAVMELNGSITVTCIFATGASSTGCQVTIFTVDNSQDMYIFSRNVTRPNGVSQVMENMLVSGLSENSVLLVKAAELLAGGRATDTLFQNMVTVASLPTTSSPTVVPTTTTTVQSTPTPFGSTFYFIIGAVGGAIVILLLLIILSMCVILSLRSRRSKRNRYLTSSEELKDNYSYGSAAILTENGGVHARSNTYDYRDDQQGAVPLYETIPNAKMGNGASAQPVPNPVYGGEVVHSGSKMVDNPVYAEANGEQRHRGTVLSQTSHTTDVSALNPVYSGNVAPLSPLSGSFSQVDQPTQSAVPQPSLGGGGSRYEMKLASPAQYATPNEIANDRYTSSPGNSEQSPYALPQESPTIPPKRGAAMGRATAVGGGEGSRYTNTTGQPIPTNPETGYSTLSRENIVEPPPGPSPVYETIKVKDTRPPVRPDGDGVTLQTNKSYGLLMSDSQATNPPTGNTETTVNKATPPGSPRSGSGLNPTPPLPPHSPAPDREPPPPPSPSDNQS